MKRKILMSFLLLLVSFVLISCKSLTVTILDCPESLRVEQSVQLNYEIRPASEQNSGVIWETSDNSLAIISEEGYLTAIAVGTVEVTAISKKYSLHKSKVNLEILPQYTDVESISAITGLIDLEVGVDLQYSAHVLL
jgi:hypothetical protein